jgi:hypothetical protein
MAHAETIRRYFSGYENGDRGAVEALLSDGFVFTSPYDYRIDRETYFKRCWPYSETSPRYGIEKVFEEGDEASFFIGARRRMAAELGTRSFLSLRERR